MAMVSSRVLFALVAVPLFAAGAVIACGDDTETKTVPTVEGGTSSSGGGSSGTTSSSGNSGTSSSGGSSGMPGEDSGGGGPCGTLAFGKPAAQFEAVDPDASATPWEGGIPQGVFDVVKAERASGNPGSWRETFVVGPNNRFSRARQLDLDGGGPNPPTYRSGTMSPDGGVFYFAFDCAIDGDASIPDDAGSIPYELVDINGKPSLRFTATGIRATTEKR
jgi:hypothetical protein